ncbi:MAG TPA: hypothetical protein VGL90_09135, partial [Casimicrobiaceae bacterium]
MIELENWTLCECLRRKQVQYDNESAVESPIARHELQLHQIFPDDDPAIIVTARRVDPHLIGDQRILGGNEMREHQHPDAGRRGDASDILGRRMVREDAPFQIGRVGHARDEPVNGGLVIQRLVHEHVGIARERDEVVAPRRVPGEYDRPVGHVEAIRERGDQRRMMDDRGGHASILVLHNEAASAQVVG